MEKYISEVDEKIANSKDTITHFEGGKVPYRYNAKDVKTKSGKSLLSKKALADNLISGMPQYVREMDFMRKGGNNKMAKDISFNAYCQQRFGLEGMTGFLDCVGVDPSTATIDSLMTSMPTFPSEFRWLVPEIFREAVYLGLRERAIYPDLIASEETVSQTSITMPAVNMSAAMPDWLGETETIPVGALSFQERTVKISKLGTGLKISDEVQRYVPLNILSVYLQDVGVQLGLGLDTLAINTLVNGDGGTGSQAAPVIGVESTTDGITYFDLLRVWIRLATLGRRTQLILSQEAAALKLLNLPEFKGGDFNNILVDTSLRNVIPRFQGYLIQGAFPGGDKVGIIDNTKSLIKLNATQMLVESERIVERQLTGTFVTMTTGFARMFNDAFVIVDGTVDFAVDGFPSYMDSAAAQNVSIGGDQY